MVVMLECKFQRTGSIIQHHQWELFCLSLMVYWFSMASVYEEHDEDSAAFIKKSAEPEKILISGSTDAGVAVFLIYAISNAV
jgi:hypothetical protein